MIEIKYDGGTYRLASYRDCLTELETHNGDTKAEKIFKDIEEDIHQYLPAGEDHPLRMLPQDIFFLLERYDGIIDRIEKDKYNAFPFQSSDGLLRIRFASSHTIAEETREEEEKERKKIQQWREELREKYNPRSDFRKVWDWVVKWVSWKWEER